MDTRSTGEVVASLIVNTQALLAKEVELAGLELRRMIGRRIAAVVVLLLGALGLAGVLLLAAATVAIALEDVLETRWMAWGVVTLGSAVIALVLVALAARTLSRSWSLDASKRALATTGTWLRDLGDELRGADRGTADREDQDGTGTTTGAPR